MVAENNASELQPDAEEPTDEQVPESTEVEAGPSEEAEPDPLAELTERLGRVEQVMSRLEGFDPHEVRSDLGRVRTLQSKIDQLASTNPLADIDPRISANEELVMGIADALVSSDLIDDPSKAALRNARTKLDEAQSQRERARLRQELLEEVRAATPQEEEAPAQQPQQDPARLAASVRVFGYAEAKGVDPRSIPKAAWTLQEGESLDQAVERVKGVVDGLASQDAAASDVARRRQAAGNGSPARAGANNIEADRERLMTDGIPLTETEKRKQIARQLGVTLAE